MAGSHRIAGHIGDRRQVHEDNVGRSIEIEREQIRGTGEESQLRSVTADDPIAAVVIRLPAIRTDAGSNGHGAQHVANSIGIARDEVGITAFKHDEATVIADRVQRGPTRQTMRHTDQLGRSGQPIVPINLIRRDQAVCQIRRVAAKRDAASIAADQR